MSRQLLLAQTMRHLGLGNRVRSVLGARELARLEGRDFRYSWPVGSWFGAAMTDLWEFDAVTTSTTSIRLRALRHPVRSGDLTWLDDRARRDAVWIIRTGHALPVPTWHEALRSLRPTQPVAELVRSLFEPHLAGEPYVGVMIRAHEVSHAQTREHSPVEWYLDRMSAIRSARPDVPFFISCDVQSVQDMVLSTVPGCFALRDKGGYNSDRALRCAVADLYLLAGSGYLVGPHYSSFPELAQVLSGSRLFMETSQTPEVPTFDTVQLDRVLDPLVPSVRT